MRADAVQRRERLLKQARALFAQHGSGVSLDAIAAASDVGIATLYRNFPSREELVHAVIFDIIDDIAQLAERARDGLSVPRLTKRTASEVWTAFVTGLVDLDLGALTEALSGEQVHFAEKVTSEQERVLELCNTVIAILIEKGVVRADLTARDTFIGIGIITRPLPHSVRRKPPRVVGKLVEAFLLWTEKV